MGLDRAVFGKFKSN